MSINLSKGQKINLEKENGEELKRIKMGLGWDTAQAGSLLGAMFGGGGSNIDLDASVILFDENKSVIETVSFIKLYSSDGSIRHSGDNLTGAGDGDDEVINVDLSTVPIRVHSLVFTINSYQGQTFDKVSNCFSRLVDTVSNTEFCTFKLAEKGAHTAMLMAKVYRHNGKWKMAALGIPGQGRTADALVELAKQNL
jgi:tellurium resistance protein TerZ